MPKERTHPRSFLFLFFPLMVKSIPWISSVAPLLYTGCTLRMRYWRRTNTSPAIPISKPCSLPEQVNKIFYVEPHVPNFTNHLLPLLWDSPRRAQQIFDGKQTSPVRHFDKTDFTPQEKNLCFYCRIPQMPMKTQLCLYQELVTLTFA